MPSRKRSLQEAESAPAEQSQPQSLIHKLRNSFYFANLYQWICIFGKVVKIDENLDIEDLETECLKHGSMALQEIGLSMLKHISSHRGLTHELFDEYTRRQFDAKMPDRKNPFGKGEVATKFSDFDLIKKLRVLWQMTQLVMMKPEHIRTNMDEQKNDEQTAWRIEPLGWDRKDREYYVLDDNRLYRLTAAPLPSAPPKKTSQKAKAAARAAKRRRVAAAAAAAADSTNDEGENASGAEDEDAAVIKQEDPLGGSTWECVAITLEETRNFIEPLKKSKDPNEKVLRSQIEEHMLPLLEKQEESRKRKMLQRERELLNLEKMANAKRSSRIAGRAEQQRQEELERQEREKRLAEEAAARKEEQARLKMEKERDNRMMSRDQRLREREARRLQHEEELAQLSEGSKGADTARLSERRLKAEIAKNKQALRELDEEEEDWVFDCICGLHGQVDDGEHSVACERCNVWQHSRCLGIAEEEAEREDFHFICKHCKQAEREKEEKQKAPTKIKIKLKEPASTSSTPSNKPVSTTPIPLPPRPGMPAGLFVDLKSKPVSQKSSPQLNGVSLPSTSASSLARPPEPSPQKQSPPPVDNGSKATATLTSGPSLPPFPLRKPSLNSVSHNPFSSPHPHLQPPNLSPNKSRAYGSIYTSSSPVVQDAPDSPVRASSERPPLSPATANATLNGHESPTKDPATKTTPAAMSPQKPGSTPVSSSKVLDQPRSSPAPVATPRLSPTRPEDAEPLPSAKGGMSPTKHSPSYSRSASASYSGPGDHNGIGSSPAPAIIPPIAALSPTPQQTDLTPPVKVDEPQRPASQHGTQLFPSHQPTMP